MFTLSDFLNTKNVWHIKDEEEDLLFSSMIEFSTELSTTLPSEAIEKGSFATYNRVIEPRIINCKLAKTGSDSQLNNYLDLLKSMVTENKKITIVTPESSYESMMLESYDYQKDLTNGNGTLLVDLRFKEIREIEVAKTTTAVDEPISEEDCEDGSMCDDVDGGEVQGQASTSAEETAASGGKKTSLLHDILGG